MKKLKIEQTSIFDFVEETNKKYKITQPIRLIELFAGIGSQAKALKNIGTDFEHYKVVEFDKYAIASYNAIHNTNFVTQDITKIKGSELEIVDTNKFCYIMTYSFPCQDLSLAGKQAGMTKGSSTRSGLLWEVERLLNETKELPQILLMENVPQVHGKKNIQDFEKWIEYLQSKGYSNYWKDLNAKDYGIPQNRNRTFMVSILGSYEYEFPKPFELKLRLKDMLEENVDENYYLSEKNITKIINSNFSQEKNRIQTKETCDTILARDYKDPKCIVEFNNKRLDKIVREKQVEPYDFLDCYNQQIKKDVSGTIKTTISSSNMHFIAEPDNRNMKEILCDKLLENNIVQENYVINHSYTNGLNGKNPNSRIKLEDYIETTDGIVNCLTTRPDVLGVVVKEATKKGYTIAKEGDSVNLTYPNSTTRRGRVGKGLSQTLTTNDQMGVVVKNLWSDTQKQMITTDGNVKRYIGSDIVDQFNEGQVADISFPNGYNKANRVFDNCPTINGTTTQTSFITKECQTPLRIRKLTPKECWRLMGFADEDFENACKLSSNSQLYKQAGNSIVVNVLEEIFKQFFKE